MRPLLVALALGFIAGCSLTLNLEGNSGRPCENLQCLEGYTCFKGTCVLTSGGTCKTAGDCPSGVCRDGGCALPPCADHLKDFHETDLDCGGPLCGKCDAGESCKVSSDCSAKVCDAG